MAEPTSTAMGTAAIGVGLAALLPGIDGNALIGAFAGATFFVLPAHEHPLLTRAIYMLISIVMGYIGAPEITDLTFIKETGVAACIAGASCVYIPQQLRDRLNGKLDLVELLKRLRS